MPASPLDRDALLARLGEVEAKLGATHLEILELIAQVDRDDLSLVQGARDTADLVSMSFGISLWKAHRWVEAARVIGSLTAIARALQTGHLSIDKVVELTRFATREDQVELVAWARRVPSGAIRETAELRRRTQRDEAASDAEARSVRWRFLDGGRRFWMAADLPSADGIVVSRALARLASRVPAMPGEEDRRWFTEERRADALVALAQTSLARDGDLDRATVVLHATPEALASDDGSVAAEGGPIVHAATARRLACTARVQAVLEDASGTPIRLGRMRREPSAWMMRQLRHRDRGCVFPGCGYRTFTHGHHIQWWEHGGRTDLDNLVLVCTFHHRLVHEHGWSIERDPVGGTVGWFRPDGSRHGQGPAPPVETVA